LKKRASPRRIESPKKIRLRHDRRSRSAGSVYSSNARNAEREEG